MNFFKFLVLSSLAAVTAAAPAYCEEDEEGSGKVFNSIKKAITEKDRDLFVSRRVISADQKFEQNGRGRDQKAEKSGHQIEHSPEHGGVILTGVTVF